MPRYRWTARGGAGTIDAPLWPPMMARRGSAWEKPAKKMPNHGLPKWAEGAPASQIALPWCGGQKKERARILKDASGIGKNAIIS